MKFAVDSNILVSFFRNNPVNNLIVNFKSFKLDLFTSDINIEELKKNKENILKYSGLNSEQFSIKLKELLSFVRLIPINSCKEFEKKAKTLAPHDKDIPIFALALKLSCAIWSNEPSFKLQDKVNIVSTRDLIELMG
jgi:predicted nucleic acid-binding protein